MGFKISDAWVDVEFRVEDAQARIDKALSGRNATVKIEAETSQVDTAISRLTSKAARVVIRADALDVERKIALLNARQLRIDADTEAAGKKLDALGVLAKTATGDKKLKVDADIAAARAKLAALDLEAEQLAAARAQITVDVDSAGAQSELAAAEIATSALNGRRANVTVDADVGSALAKIAAVGAALAGLGGVAVAGLGAAAGVGAVVAGGIGSFAASLTGVGDAVKALGESNKAAGGSAGGAASQHNQLASAIDRVKLSQVALKNAQLDAASAQRRSAESIADSRRRLEQAEVGAARAAEQASQRVEQATTRERAAVESLQRAQEDLTRARKDAARQAEDLNQRTKQLALDERAAQDDLEDAKKTLDRLGSRADQEARERAQLAFDQAKQRMEDLRLEQQRTAEDKAGADGKGVDGSDEVLSAQDRILQIQQEITAAQEATNQARAAESEVARKSAEEIADAQRGLTEATLAAADQRRHSEASVAQAAQAVVEAQRAVQNASQAAGGGGSAAMNKLDDAMSKLSPTGQKFAKFLRGFIDGEIADLRHAGQDNLLPGLQRGLEALEPILDRRVTPALGRFSAVLGKGLEAGIPIAGRLGASLLDFGTTSLRGLAPLEEKLNKLVTDLDSTFTELEQSGDAERAMGALVDILGAFLDVIPDIVEGGTQMLAAIGPGLADVAEAFAGQISALVDLFVEWSPAINTALSAVAPLAPAITIAALAFVAMRRATTSVVGAVKDVGSVFTSMTGRAKEAAEGTKKVEESHSKLSGVIGKVGIAYAALAVASSALDSGSGAKGINTTAEALEALARGGEDSSDVLRNLDSDLNTLDLTGRGFQKTIEGVALYGNIMEGSIAHVDERISSLDSALASMVSSGSPGQAAAAFDKIRQRADEQGVSLEDLKRAFPEYQDALDGMSRKSRTAETATDRLNAAMKRVTDGFLAGRDAETRYFEAVDRATESARENGKTLDVHTSKGRANRDAFDGLTRQSLAYVQSLIDQGAPSAKVQGALDTTRTKLIEAGTKFGLTATEAKKYADRILGVPSQATTTVKLNGIAEAIANLNGLTQRLAIVNGQYTAITARIGSGNDREDRKAIGVRALGGPVEKGQPYIVGDGGRPELFVPDQSGTIIPDLGLLRRPAAAAPEIQQVGGTTPRPAGGVTIQEFHFHAPAVGWEAFSALSPTGQQRVARQVRDAITKVEGATR